SSVAVGLAIIQVGKNLVEALRWPFDPLKSNVSTCCQFQREKLRQFFKPWMHVPAIRRSDDKAFLFYVLQDQHRAAACHLCNLKRALFARGNIIAPGVLDCLIEKTTQG